MIASIRARFRSQFSYRGFERCVLQDFAAFRLAFAALGALALYTWQAPSLGAWALVAVPANGLFLGWVSADFLEHYGRILALGYAYNPNVSARCELEGGNMPSNPEAQTAWRATILTRIAVGDDPGSGQYDLPIPTLGGRLRALWSDA